MTISFVILAHNDAPTLESLLEVLSPYRVFLHVDKSAVKGGYLDHTGARSMNHVIINPNSRCLHWGGYSIVQAMMETLSIAISEGSFQTDHIAFLSGQCFPLRPIREFEAYLATSANPVHCRAFDLAASRPPLLGMTRVSRRHWLDGPIGHIRWTAPRMLGGGMRRAAMAASAPFSVKLPNIVHACGSQWVAVPRALAIELVAHYLAGGFDYLKNSYAADEMAIPSYIYNSDWAGLTQAGELEELGGTTVAPYANYHWLRDDLQGLVNRSEALAGIQSKRYFIRKVSESTTGGVMDLLRVASRA